MQGLSSRECGDKMRREPWPLKEFAGPERHPVLCHPAPLSEPCQLTVEVWRLSRCEMGGTVTQGHLRVWKQTRRGEQSPSSSSQGWGSRSCPAASLPLGPPLLRASSGMMRQHLPPPRGTHSIPAATLTGQPGPPHALPKATWSHQHRWKPGRNCCKPCACRSTIPRVSQCGWCGALGKGCAGEMELLPHNDSAVTQHSLC